MVVDNYVVTVAPAETPVTLAEAKAFCRVDVDLTADDTLITALIDSVVATGEQYTNRCFVTRTIEGYYSGMCTSQLEQSYFLHVRRAPLIAISAVEYYSDDAYTAFTDFTLRQTHGFSRILFPSGVTDAVIDADAVYPWKVTFTAGYGAAADVPQDIKQALLAHVNFLYENRGDVIADGKIGMPLETVAIYRGKYRILDTF
jgi:uncharacterized phiE125 gp8 family phage protein